MTKKLYEEIKEEIPKHIGVYLGDYCVKKAKKQELIVDEQILKNSMIRSLSRENEKFIKTGDNEYLNKLNNQINRLEKELRENSNKAIRYSSAIYEICSKYNLNYKEVKEWIRDIKDD